MYAEMSESFKTVSERFDKIENEVRKTDNAIENDIKPKVEALSLATPIEHLQEQLNERLDTIQTDLSYVVGKTAQHKRSFIKLNKKQNRFANPK